jgi:hypothetical protein
MCREVGKLSDLWTVGLRSQLAIATLDSRWGQPVGGQSELQFYSLWLEIIKEIRRTAQAQRISEEAAMHAMSFRQMGCSIDQLCKLLRANRRTWLAAQKKKK